MKKSYPESICIALDDIELEVYFSISPAHPAMRDPGGNYISPAEPLSIEISGVYLSAADKMADLFDLFAFSISDIEEKVLLELSELSETCED